jgi:hypothetical protein
MNLVTMACRKLTWLALLPIVACGSPASPTSVVTAGPAAVPTGTPTSGSTVAASIASFSVVEVQSVPGGGWYYAPQLRIAATGNIGITVTSLHFEIPGLLPAPLTCGAWHVNAGTSGDLFREIYGDYELTIDNSGNRSTGGVATAVLTVTDDNGTLGTITGQGPIVSGSPPMTYTTGGTAGRWTPCGR